MVRVLVTRPMPAAARSAARIEALGHQVHVAPLLVFRPLPLGRSDLPAAGDVGALAVTSARSLEALAGAGLGADFAKHRLFAVGAVTAAAARAAGFGDVVAAGGTLADLVARIARARPAGPVLYLAGRERSGDLAGDLRRQGIEASLVETYAVEQLGEIPQNQRDALAGANARDEAPVFAPVYSRRSALALAGALGRWRERPAFRFLAMSARAGEPLRDLGPVAVAARSEEAALLDLLPARER